MMRLVLALRDLIRVVRFASFVPRLGPIRSCERPLVLGNGPSFRTTFESHPFPPPDHDVFCVNYFPTTDVYLSYKPRFCVFADFRFWADDLAPMDLAKRTEVFARIESVTTWQTFVLFPASARKDNARNVPKFTNPHVTVAYFSSTLVGSYLPIPVLARLCDWNLAIAGMQTVVGCCVSIAVSMGYEQVNLVGTDTSFLEDIAIDDERNLMVTRDRHYYDNGHDNSRPIFKDAAETEPAKVHEFLDMVAQMLREYQTCRLYADYRNVKVINSSAHSWIDSFPRGSLGA